MVHGVVQPCALCLVVLGFGFRIGGGSWFPSGGWLFCHLLSIKQLSALCSFLPSEWNISPVFRSRFPELLFRFSLWWWSCPLGATQLPVLMCLMRGIRAAPCAPTCKTPSFSNSEQLKTFPACFRSRAALPTFRCSCHTVRCRPGCILGLVPMGHEQGQLHCTLSGLSDGCRSPTCASRALLGFWCTCKPPVNASIQTGSRLAFHSLPALAVTSSVLLQWHKAAASLMQQVSYPRAYGHVRNFPLVDLVFLFSYF